jgi:hypothetical protein
MRAIAYLGALALVASTAACGGFTQRSMNPSVPFDSGLRPSLAAGSTCSPADSSCGSGVNNPSVQSPVQQREQRASPQ